MLTSEKQLGDGDLQPTRLNCLACIDLHAGSGAVTPSVRPSVGMQANFHKTNSIEHRTSEVAHSPAQLVLQHDVCHCSYAINFLQALDEALSTYRGTYAATHIHSIQCQ